MCAPPVCSTRIDNFIQLFAESQNIHSLSTARQFNSIRFDPIQSGDSFDGSALRRRNSQVAIAQSCVAIHFVPNQLISYLFVLLFIYIYYKILCLWGKKGESICCV